MHISELKDIHAGESAAILGNGPSLRNYDYAEIATDIIIGMNKSWTLDGETVIPQYSALVNYHVTVNADQFRDVAVHMKFQPRTGVVAFSKHSHLARPLPKFPPIIYVRQKLRRSGFDYNLAKGSEAEFAGTLAIQVALWMGCGPIYLLGYDSHYGEGHHCDDLVVTGKNRDRMNRDRQLSAYPPIQEYLAKNEPIMFRRIYNCEPASAIQCFPFRPVPRRDVWTKEMIVDAEQRTKELIEDFGEE